MQMAEEKKTGALTKFAQAGGVATMSREQRLQAMEGALDDTTSDSDVTYLSFSGQGKNYGGWQMGRDKKSPDPENVYVVDPLSFFEGWRVWKGGGVAYSIDWSLYEKAQKFVHEADLPDHGPYGVGDGPSMVLGWSLFEVDNPSQRIQFTATSKSARNATGDIIEESFARFRAEEPDVPVIMLDDEAFVAQGKPNGKPKFIVEGWVTMAEVMTFIEMGDDGDLETLLNGGYLKSGDTQAAEEPEQEDAPEPEPQPKSRSKRSARRPSRVDA